MKTWEISDKESFYEVKEYYNEENLSILSSEKTDTGFTVFLSDGDEYRFPPETWKWIAENTPKVSDKTPEIDMKEDSSPYSNDLIFGKNKTENIVSIDVKDDTVFIYREIDGIVTCETEDMEYWIMSNRKPFGEFDRMQGNLHYRYLKKFGVKKDWSDALAKLWKIHADKYTSYNQSEAFMLRNGHTYFKGMKVEDVSILSFDIETNKTLDPDLDHAFTMLISNTFRKNGVITRKLFAIDEYKNELDMIYSWCAWVQEIDPSIMTGHNIIPFDLRYLHRRVINTRVGQIVNTELAAKLGIISAKGYPKGLPIGRDGSIIDFSKKTSEKRIPGGATISYHKATLFGRELADGWFISMDYDIGKKFVSYGLKPIEKCLVEEYTEKKSNGKSLTKSEAQVLEFGTGRVEWNFEEECPIQALEDKGESWEKYKKYCINDSDTSLALFDLMIPARFYLCQSIPKSFQTITETASGSQINSFLVRGYLQNGYSIPKPSEKVPFEGAISYGGPGIYHNVYKLDVASLYPSIMRQWEIYDRRKDPLKLFSETVEYFTLERLKNKGIANDTGSQYHRDLEQAQKIVINSLYGFMGAAGLHFNSPANAAEVTRKGREILTKAVEWASGFTFERVIKKQTEKTTKYHWVIENKTSEGQGMLIPNTDTDSFSFSMPDGRKLTDYEFNDISKKVNELFPEKIIWEDDGYFEDFVVLAAKNYIMRNGTKIKYKGSSIVDAKKEPALAEMMKVIGTKLLDGDIESINDIYFKYIKEACNPRDIKRWTKKISVSKAVLDCENNPDARANEIKIWNAIKDKSPQEGDKFWVYTFQDGMKQKVVKGELVFLKSGEPKMEPNFILKCSSEYDNDHVVSKLAQRCYDTLKIFDTILDMDEFINYKLTRNLTLLDELK